MFLSAGLSLAVVGGTEEVDSPRARRDSKSMSVHGTCDRTADRRSKGVINLLFKSKVRPSELMQSTEKHQGDRLKNQCLSLATHWSHFGLIHLICVHAETERRLMPLSILMPLLCLYARYDTLARGGLALRLETEKHDYYLNMFTPTQASS